MFFWKSLGRNKQNCPDKMEWNEIEVLDEAAANDERYWRLELEMHWPPA